MNFSHANDFRGIDLATYLCDLTSQRCSKRRMQAEDNFAHKAAQVFVIGSAHEQAPAVRGVLRRLLAHPECD